MLTILLVTVFILAYSLITVEHWTNLNKSGTALLGAGLLWTIYALSAGDIEIINHQLNESLVNTAQIIFFLMGAMTIVEVIDSHNGFEAITRFIKIQSLSRLIIVIGSMSFFLSAILDNLAATIVMLSIARKMVHRREDRLYFAGIIVIAANAGGAWSPIGDVTTTMLWIGGQITAFAIVKALFFPALVSLIVPLALSAYSLRGQQIVAIDTPPPPTITREAGLTLLLSFMILLAIPLFKTVTELPPFMGMFLGLGALWIVTDYLYRSEKETKNRITLANAMEKIDMASLMFFTGILLAVAVLEHTHILAQLARMLDQWVARQDLIVLLIGFISAIFDNVPLVSAVMGMYSLTEFPTDHFLWKFLAYCTGTGGSLLILGSAAGIAAMGMEKISFMWYLKKMSGLALLGYLAGAGVYCFA